MVIQLQMMIPQKKEVVGAKATDVAAQGVLPKIMFLNGKEEM